MGYNLLINGAYWDYNPLTNHLLTFWDIQVGCCLLLLVAGCWLFKRPDHSGDRRCSSILSEPSWPSGRPKAILSTTVTWELLRVEGGDLPQIVLPPTHQSWKKTGQHKQHKNTQDLFQWNNHLSLLVSQKSQGCFSKPIRAMFHQGPRKNKNKHNF